MSLARSISVNEKPLRLSELIPLLQASLDAEGDCKITVGCPGEGIGGDPAILRGPHGLEFAFYWVTATPADKVLWGDVEP